MANDFEGIMKYLFLCILLIFLGCSNESLEEQQTADVSIKLNKIIKINDEKSIPIDIAFNKKEKFILDWGNKNVTKISEEGQSIGFLHNKNKLIDPGAIAFTNSNLLISDRFSRELYFYSDNGQYLSNLPLTDYRLDNLLIKNNNLFLRTRNYRYEDDTVLVRELDYNGEVKNNIGSIKPIKGMLKDKVLQNEVEMALEKNIIVFANKYHNPEIKIVDAKNNEVIRNINYKLSYDPGDYINKETEEYYSDYTILQSLDLDENYIYAVVKKRKVTKRESNAGKFITDENGTYLLENKVRSAETNLNELLVFTVDGKFVKRIELNYFCNKLKIHDNKLYLIDSFIGKQIYEFDVIKVKS